LTKTTEVPSKQTKPPLKAGIEKSGEEKAKAKGPVSQAAAAGPQDKLKPLTNFTAVDAKVLFSIATWKPWNRRRAVAAVLD